MCIVVDSVGFGSESKMKREYLSDTRIHIRHYAWILHTCNGNEIFLLFGKFDNT